MFGNVILYVLFFMSIISTGAFFYSYNRKTEAIDFARKLFWGIIIGLSVISVFFMINIFAHNFQYTYIYEYSSRQLPTYLLFASFFSGQSGSFLFWALMFAFIGLFLMPYARRRGNESLVMGFYSLILLFIFLMLIAKSPFDYIWQSYAEKNIAIGFTPENGRGLNPILENFWITIHPPILFLGYAAMSVPFVFAMAGLIRRNYQNWISIALPWTLFASGMLGLGLMIGGFWAYETLGWGGFWGWDPVENSSLLPWLSSVALIHTMLVQKKTGGLRKTNFVLAVVTFVLVLYATFLTRSGVLANSSVHSFTDPGSFVYVLLIIFQIFFVLIGVYAINMRAKDISSKKLDFNFTSREFALSIGSIIILLSTFIIFIGTSLPLLAEIVGQTKSSVAISFYNEWNLPLVVLILIINAISLYLSWMKSSLTAVFKKLLISLTLAIISTVLIFVFGVTDLKFIFLGFAGFFSLFVNFEFLIRNVRNNPKKIGGYLSHIGIALLMLGVLTSGGYKTTKHLNLTKNESAEAFGYAFTFKDKIRIEKELTDRQKFQYNIQIEKDNWKTLVNSVVYWSSFNEWKTPILEPGIKRFLFKDIYISPKSVNFVNNVKNIVIIKSHTSAIPLDSSLNITLLGFDMGHSSQAKHDEKIKLGAIVKISNNDFEIEDTLFANMNVHQGTSDTNWINISGTEIDIAFQKLIPESKQIAMSRAVFSFKKSGEAVETPIEIFTVDVIIEPFINLVWLGVIAIAFGFFISMFRYRND